MDQVAGVPKKIPEKHRNSFTRSGFAPMALRAMLAVNAASVMTVSVRRLRSEWRVDSLIALSARIQSWWWLAVVGGDDSDGDYDCGGRDEDEDVEMGHDKEWMRLTVSTAQGRLTTSFHETRIQSIWRKVNDPKHLAAFTSRQSQFMNLSSPNKLGRNRPFWFSQSPEGRVCSSLWEG